MLLCICYYLYFYALNNDRKNSHTWPAKADVLTSRKSFGCSGFADVTFRVQERQPEIRMRLQVTPYKTLYSNIFVIQERFRLLVSLGCL